MSEADTPKIVTTMRKLYLFTAHVTFSTMLLLLLLEGATRLLTEPVPPVDINAQTLVSDSGVQPFFQYHPFSAFSWIPNVRFRKQTVNRDGFVSTRDIPLEKAPGELRIVTLGGSSTVGNRNHDEDTYPRVLETLLQERFPEREISVINAAAGGYTTIESLGYFQTRMVHYRPDIVLVMHAWNDMYYFTRSDLELSEWRKGINLQRYWSPEATSELQDPMPADLQYLSWSQLYLHLRGWASKSELFDEGEDSIVETRHRPYRAPINPSAYQVYRSNMSQIENLCAVRSLSCFTILQPTLVSAAADPDNQKVVRARERATLRQGFDFDTHVVVFDTLYSINREVFGTERTIDATVMNGADELFFDHVHMNPQGTRRLAEIVFERVVGEIG
jgi:lysophospholipase L1-like esterase